MNLLLEQVKLYLTAANNGEAEMSDEIINDAVEAFRNTLKTTFSKQDKTKKTLRMSSVGRPLCQQQMEQADAARTPDDYSFRMKMLIGDMTEIAAVAIMKAAGVSIVSYQEPVTVDIGGIKLAGTLDLKVREGDKLVVYDVKSASPYAFATKFNGEGAFAALREDDAFGYVAQGYLYAEGAGARFGGWIAIEKSTGEWAVLETPILDNSYRKEALKQVEANILAIKEGAPFKRCFEPVEETYYGKKTGNMMLGVTCAYCPFKEACWGDQIVHAAQPKSKAKNPKKNWYLGEPK